MRKTAKLKNGNGKTQIALSDLHFDPYEEVVEGIVEKIGKRPELPKYLPKGEWTQQAMKVLEERYLMKNGEGVIIETPEQMCWRVSWEIASAEARWGKGRKEIKKTAVEYYKMLVAHEFLPNSPTLMNAGTGNYLQYSACFVLPVGDSLIEIFEALKYQALIHQTGGGTGFAFSRLRQHGAMVKSSKGTASGPVSFMRIFDAATNEVKQGGKRRGANMGILRIDHPDIKEFIHCKEEGGITNFNISVAITDKFMEAYKNDTEYDLINPATKEVVGQLPAREVFDEIAEGAWRTGDPGLVFIDRINAGTANPVPTLGPVESTNPCGEQPLYPFDSCNLGSIFLTYFVKEVKGKKEVDWEKLRKATRTAVRFLDGVIEMNPYTLPQIRQTTLAIRRIGLGVGGWADMLIEMGIPYDSTESLGLAEKIMQVIQEEAVAETKDLAKVRGPFPLWPVSIYAKEEPRRNSTVTTIAPTGTISIIAGASSGIEPLFAIAFQHKVKDKHLDRTLTFVNPKFEEVAKNMGFWSEAVKEKVAQHGVVRDIEEVPADIRKVFGTAHEMHHDWHIKHQAAFQRHTENAVSKTINMDNSVTVKEIKEAYLLAWETNCKGVTVFRDGCKDAQVLNLGIKDKETQKAKVEEESVMDRPFKVVGATYRLHTPVGTAFITINQDQEGEPLEIFINVGKAGSDVTAMAEALGRTISTAFRFRGNIKASERAREIAMQLAGIGGRRSVGFGPNKILSLPDAIAAALSTHYGFKVNGFDKLGELNGMRDTYSSNGNAKVASDVAGAVMTALPSANAESPISGNDDLTTASAASNAALADKESHSSLQESLSDGSGFHLTLNSPKVAGDICPSCGASSLVYQEGCAKCYSCGHSEC
jgi:ribonucleoside-diphosphate reductase alpha chain